MRQMTMEIYLKHLQTRYWRANRKGKAKILNEFCSTSGYHRKHAIRILKHKVVGWREKPPGRKKEYRPEQLLPPLKQIWLATDQMCGKRLKMAIPLIFASVTFIFEATGQEVAFLFSITTAVP